MNRAERRAFMKQAKKNGISQQAAESYIMARELGLNKPILPVDINEGDKVELNIEGITNRESYGKMSPKYRNFVEGHADVIFTAHIEDNGLVSFLEHPEWLFYSGDLKIVDEGEE